MSNSRGCLWPSPFSWKDSPSVLLDKRKSPQGWKTTPYILGNEVTERIASFGLTWSMILYLTQKYHMSKVSAYYWSTITSGITGLTPLFGGFIADAYLGRYRTILYGSISNLLGMVWLSLTAIVPTVMPGPCSGEGSGPKICPRASKSQMGFLLMAYVFLAIGSGGIRPCLYAFGADQFGNTTIEEKKQLQSFFNLYYFALTIALFLAGTVIVYIQLDVSWALGFGLPAGLVAISIVLFLCGSSKYRYVAPTGSPITDVVKVIVAAYRKRNVALPSDPSELYHGEDQGSAEQSCAKGQAMLAHTDQFRCLDKAAVMAEGEVGGRGRKEWRLSDVHKVEQVKCLARVVPIWASGIVAATNLAQQSTFVPLQAQVMDRHLTRNSSFQVPPSSIAVVGLIAVVVWLPFYDRALVPLARKLSRDTVRGISPLHRIAIGYLLNLLSLLVAALVEARRRRSPSSPSPISVLWLVPQLLLFGIADAFYIIGLLEFFYDEMPPSMRSVAGALFSCTLALGSFLGSIVLAIVQRVTGRSGHRKWIAETLSRGHLDYFYYLLAVMLGLNCVYFFVCARNYKPCRLQPADLTHVDQPDVGPGTDKADHSTEEAGRPATPKDHNAWNKMTDV